MSLRRLRPTPARLLRAMVPTTRWLRCSQYRRSPTPPNRPTAAPHWQLVARPAPTTFTRKGEAMLVDIVSNIGDANVAGENETVTFTDKLPAGMEVTEMREAIPAANLARPKQQFHVTCSGACHPVRHGHRALVALEYVDADRVEAQYARLPPRQRLTELLSKAVKRRTVSPTGLPAAGAARTADPLRRRKVRTHSRKRRASPPTPKPARIRSS